MPTCTPASRTGPRHPRILRSIDEPSIAHRNDVAAVESGHIEEGEGLAAGDWGDVGPYGEGAFAGAEPGERGVDGA